MERLSLYHIDMKYVRDLHNADDRVESVSPQIGKANRILDFHKLETVCDNYNRKLSEQNRKAD